MTGLTLKGGLSWLNRGLGQRLGLFMALAAVLGWLAGPYVRRLPLEFFIPVSLSMMLFPAMLDVDGKSLKESGARPKLLCLALAFNFLLCPLLGMTIYHIFLQGQPAYVLAGFTLFALVPCGGMVPAYTAMVGGNVSLASAIVAVSLLTSLVAVPFGTQLIIGRQVPVPVPLMMTYLFITVALPLSGAMVLQRLLIKLRGDEYYARFRDQFKKLSPYGMFSLFFIVFALNAENLLRHPQLIVLIIPPAAVYLAALLFLSRLLSKLLTPSISDRQALVMGSTVKNTALAIALGASAFGGLEALVAAIAGPLVQLPIMLCYVRFNNGGARNSG